MLIEDSGGGGQVEESTACRTCRGNSEVVACRRASGGDDSGATAFDNTECAVREYSR